MPFGIVKEEKEKDDTYLFTLEEEEDFVPKIKKERKPQKKKEDDFFDTFDLNDFLRWVLEIDPNDYPASSAIIKRAQRYRRTGFLKDAIELLKKYIEKKKGV